MNTKIGVLSLQGGFREHVEMLKKCGADAVEVRLSEDLKGVCGIIIPGGESTTIGNLMQRHGLDTKIIQRHRQGMAVYGTCAGAILLAKEIIGSGQPSLNLLDISVRRNDYGRQADSFETELDVEGVGKFKGIFIRAPVIENAGSSVRILSDFHGKPVLVQKGSILASTFHPELTQDARVHEHFIKMANEYSQLL